jgi:hypothetical protein
LMQGAIFLRDQNSFQHSIFILKIKVLRRSIETTVISRQYHAPRLTSALPST